MSVGLACVYACTHVSMYLSVYLPIYLQLSDYLSRALALDNKIHARCTWRQITCLSQETIEQAQDGDEGRQSALLAML